MTTRREVITKCGLGIAGIIAAGKSPAVIVRSLLGAAETGISSNVNGWVNPYITDSLIAMWDGEWNAGPGKHDANVTGWKDLSGNEKNFVWETGTAGVHWQHNHLALANGDKTKITIAVTHNITGLPISAPKTVEIVTAIRWVFNDNYGNIQSPFSLYGAAHIVGRYPGPLIVPHIPLATDGKYYAFAQLGKAAPNWLIVSGSIAQPPSSPCVMYANEQSYTVLANYSGDSSGTLDDAIINRPPRSDARLYCVRIYSRALTADEIAHNYKIDKARFNLQ